MRKNGVRDKLLARLRAGPLPGDDWSGLCQSRHALNANIWRLRQEGYDIKTEGGGGRSGRYVLKETT